MRVPFGRKEIHAFIVEEPKSISELKGVDSSALKSVLEVGPDVFFTEDVLKLCDWAHDYYFSPIGEVLNCAAPAAALGLKSAKKTARSIQPPQAFVEGHELTAAPKRSSRELTRSEQLQRAAKAPPKWRFFTE